MATPITASFPFDARWHLRAEMAELIEQLAVLLGRRADAAELVSSLRSQWSDGTESRVRPGQLRQAEARSAFLPLRHARQAFDLSAGEYRILLVALAVEIDPRFGRLITTPTLGLAFSLASSDVEIPAGLAERPIFRDGLLDLHGDGPLPERSARLSPSLIARLTGADKTGSIPPPLEFWPLRQGALDELVLEDGFRRSLSALIENIRTAPGTPSWTLLLTGKKGSGKTAVARALAGELRISVVAGDLTHHNRDEELRRIRRECRWHKASPLVKIAGEDFTAQDWRKLWTDLLPQHLHQPTLFVELESGDPSAALEAHPDHPVTIEIPDLGRPERSELWGRLLPRGHSLSEEEWGRLAARFAFSPRVAVQAVGKARADLALRPAGQRRIDFAAVLEASRAIGKERMSALADRLPLPFRFEDLIVPDEIREEISFLLASVRHKKGVPGVAALLCGPPGTGKTVAAQVLARELDLDLYRVNPIGQDLDRLFDEAHACGAVLLFDDVDANVDAGYLLRRTEAHDGMTLVATNRREHLDEAVVRRFHSVVSLPMPDEESRLRIWQGMLPDLDVSSLAKNFEISGGEIRNCVTAASYMAAAENRPVAMSHLERAVRRARSRKMGT